MRALVSTPRILVVLLLLAGQLPLAALHRLPSAGDTAACSCSCGADCACGPGCCGHAADNGRHRKPDETRALRLQDAAAWRAEGSCGCCDEAMLPTTVRRDLLAVLLHASGPLTTQPPALLPPLSRAAGSSAANPCRPGPRGPPSLRTLFS